MQRLIAIDLRDGEVIFKFTGQRFIERMQCAKRGIAACIVLNDNTKAVQIQHLRKRQMLLDHLPVNRVQGFLPTKDFGFYARLRQFIG